jgi:hypothetical protein
MKKLLLFITLLTVFFGYSQKSDIVGSNGLNIRKAKQTAKLKLLYQEAKAMENTGTVEDIKANRQAIKAAWQEVDPAIAALYKPVDVGGALPITEENIQINGIIRPDVIKKRPELPKTKGTEDWGVDYLLRPTDRYVDDVDMDVTTDEGIIYVATLTRYVAYGEGDRDSLFVFKSVNHGASFDSFAEIGIPASIKKIEILSIDGSTGDNYINLFTLFDSKTFQVLRYTEGGSYQGGQVINTDAIDFNVDRNWPFNTALQRVYATYQKSDHKIYSARSTVGSYGFDWIDEFNIGDLYANQGNLCYGKNGAIYLTCIGFVSGNLYAITNTNHNDPASWEAEETIEAGSTAESLNPVIVAARNNISSDKVIVLCSSRPAGSTDGFDGNYYKRENGNPYTSFTYMSTGTAYNTAHINAWIRRSGGAESFQTTYVRDRIDDSDNDVNRSRTYNGSGFDAWEAITTIDVFDGFATAVAETRDGIPCVAYAGTFVLGSETWGSGLYFDAKSNLLADNDNDLAGFTMYPNPVQDILSIQATETIETISVYNMLGQEVINTSKTQIDMSALPSGSYIVKVQAGLQTGSYKLIKE